VDGSAPELIEIVRPVGDQAASANEEAFVKDRGQFVPGRKRKRWGAPLGRSRNSVKSTVVPGALVVTSKLRKVATRMDIQVTGNKVATRMDIQVTDGCHGSCRAMRRGFLH
jgi:hypothetical protein